MESEVTVMDRIKGRLNLLNQEKWGEMVREMQHNMQGPSWSEFVESYFKK